MDEKDIPPWEEQGEPPKSELRKRLEALDVRGDISQVGQGRNRRANATSPYNPPKEAAHPVVVNLKGYGAKLKSMGLTVCEYNNGHHLKFTCCGVKFDFWPSSGRWIEIGKGETRQGGLLDRLNQLRQKEKKDV